MKQLSREEMQNEIERFDNSNPVTEQAFVDAYDTLFSEISRISPVCEGGLDLQANISMSKWVDPLRVINVVVHNKDVLSPTLINVIKSTMTILEGDFAVGIEHYPTLIYIFPTGRILGLARNKSEDLRALGLA